MKVLVVKYLPRGERSHTKKLLDAFLEAAPTESVETLDLIADLPDVFLPDNLLAYIRRNYLGEELTSDQAGSLAKMDRMTAQLKAAEAVVLAFPMHNFSFPAPVKAWFDSVMLKGETWDVAETGYVGLMQGKKALVLMASGGAYDGDYAPYEHALSLAQVEFGFLGFDDVQCVSAQGMNLFPDRAEEIVAEQQTKVREVAASWFGG